MSKASHCISEDTKLSWSELGLIPAVFLYARYLDTDALSINNEETKVTGLEMK